MTTYSKPEFLFGHLRHFRRDQIGFLSQFADATEIVPLRFLNKQAYLLRDGEHIHEALVKQSGKLHKSPALKNSTKNSLGDGLLTSDDPLHKQQRKLAQPAFHARQIANYADTIVAFTDRYLARWGAETTLEIHEQMMLLTMEIIAKVLFDADVAGDAHAFGNAITTSINATMQRINSPLARFALTPKQRQAMRDGKILDDLIYGLIAERQASGNNNGDLLSMLLFARDEETGEGMDIKQLRDECMTLFIAGHETTANALSWAFYLLAQHPEEWRKVQAEADRVLGQTRPTFEHVKALTYTDWVVKESMRLFPPAYVTSRLIREDVQIGGKKMKAGEVLIMSQYLMHHHPAYWEQPEQFNPQRFATDRTIKEGYFPFGGGVRVCIGNHFAMMEAILILARIAQRVDVEWIPNQHITAHPAITLRPEPGIQLRLVARQLLPTLA